MRISTYLGMLLERVILAKKKKKDLMVIDIVKVMLI